VPRRANGEGSVFRRKDGTWSAELSYRDEYGALKRRTVYGRTQAEVRAKFRDARERIESGAPVKDASMTVGAWLEDWIAKSLAASDRKQATKDLYATLARTHLVPTVGTIPLGRLRPSDLEALIVTKRDAGLARSTIRTIYTVLWSALDIASRDGLIRSNPSATVRRPGVERKDAPHLTADQAQALLEAIRGDRLESLFRVLLATGLRVRASGVSSRRAGNPASRATALRKCRSGLLSVMLSRDDQAQTSAFTIVHVQVASAPWSSAFRRRLVTPVA
jgi:integrase